MEGVVKIPAPMRAAVIQVAPAEQALDRREHFGRIVIEVGGDAVTRP